MVELGAVIGEKDNYEDDKDEIHNNYVSQEDFDMAKQMKKSLFDLEQLKGDIKIPTDEKKMEKEEGEEEKPDTAELTEDIKRQVKKILSPVSAQIKIIE